MLVDLFLDFDKTDRLADCSHEFTCVEFIKRWLLALRYFSLLSRNVDIVVIRCIYMYILYRDISLNLREYREVSEARVGLHRENYLCKRMLIIDELSIAMFLSIRF